MAGTEAKQPWPFWLGTTLGMGAGLVGALEFLVIVLFFPYSAETVSEYDLVLSPAQTAVMTWFPWCALAVSVTGVSVVFVSAVWGRMRWPVRVGLLLYGALIFLMDALCMAARLGVA